MSGSVTGGTSREAGLDRRAALEVPHRVVALRRAVALVQLAPGCCSGVPAVVVPGANSWKFHW